MIEPLGKPVWPKYRYFPVGDGSLTVEFGNVVDYRLGAMSTSLARSIERDGFPGLIEAVPAFASVTVYYQTSTVKRAFPQCAMAFEAVKTVVENIVDQLICVDDSDARTLEIPVAFNDRSALDLPHIADNAGLTPDEVIRMFLDGEYRVYMLGFLPGFAYMGDVDERIAVPRLSTPRTKVPKGSVGIAGKQTGIYPLESPGGWNIIARTTIDLFDPSSNEPCRLRPGDKVKFVRN